MARAILRTSHLSCSGREAGPVMFSHEARYDSTGSYSGIDGAWSDRDLFPKLDLWTVSRVLWTLRGERRRQEKRRSR